MEGRERVEGMEGREGMEGMQGRKGVEEMEELGRKWFKHQLEKTF